MARMVPHALDVQRRLAPAAQIERAGDVSSRLVSYVFSDTSVGRDNHVIAANAWQTDNYNRNPVFLWAHDSDQPPIGKVVNLRTNNAGQLVGAVQYADADASPFADSIFRLVKAGMLNATSTGWMPLEWKYTADRSRPGGIDFSKVDLLEISQVPVPALPTALATARAYGINTAPIAQWAERAIDRGNSPTSKGELEMIRRAAGAPKVYASIGDIEGRRREARALAIANGTAAPFESFGHFLQAVATNSGRSGVEIDRRLVRAPTGLGDVDPTGGGFLVPTEFEKQLIGSMYEEAVLAPLCDRRETDKPADVKLPAIDEKSRADGSRWGGTLSYWENEGDQAPNSFPKFRSLEFAAHKLIALCVTSEELVRDVPLLEGHIRRAFASEAAFKLDKAILAGTGAGTPLGITNAPATISVAKQNGQASGTIVSENIANIWSRLAAPCRKRAVWIVNEDAEAQFDQIGQSGSTPGTAGMYFPAGANGNEFALIKGRPVIVAEQSPLLGTPGIVLRTLANIS